MKKRILIFTLTAAGAAAVLCLLSFIGGEKMTLEGIFAGSGTQYDIFFHIRLPRVIFAFMVGAVLSVGGLVFQSIFKNDLAAPFTLGIASGASFGTLLAVQLGLLWTMPHLKIPFAFTGAVVSVLLVTAVSRLGGRSDVNTLLLAGVSVNFLFSALILFLQYLFNPHDLGYAVRWMMGNIETYGYGEIKVLSIFFIAIILFSFFFGRHLDILRLGDDISASKGIYGPAMRMILFVSASVMIAGAVSFAGPVGFVGLIIPHMVKLCSKGSHTQLTFYTVLTGGIFLAAADTVARLLFYPAEMPVGIITSLIGVPFFLYRLVRRGKAAS